MDAAEKQKRSRKEEVQWNALWRVKEECLKEKQPAESALSASEG